MMPWITLFTSLVLFVINTPEGVCDESSNGGQFEGCLWTWSEWTTCDPGLCNQPRNVKDRIRNILQAPLKRVNQSCSFGKLDSENMEIQSEACVTGEPCYWANYSCGAKTTQCFDGYCIPEYLANNGDRDCMDGSDETPYFSGFMNSPCPEEIRDQVRKLPHTEVWSRGRDILYHRIAKPVLREAFWGTCEVTDDFYRKQYNVLDVNAVRDQDVPDTVTSYLNWVSFAKHMQDVLGHSEEFVELYHKLEELENVTFHKGTHMILTDHYILKEPKQLLIRPDFESALSILPRTFSYEPYFSILEQYGTHFMQRATFGGLLRMYFGFDKSEKQDTDVIEQSIYNFLEYLKGNSSLEYGFEVLKKSRFQRFIVTGGKTHYADMDSLTLRRFDQDLYKEWLDSLQFYPEIIDINTVTGTGDSSTAFLPISRLLEGDHVKLDNKINIWENLERAITAYTQPYADPGSLCVACPVPEESFIVPDSQAASTQSSKKYGCVCNTEDGKPPTEVSEESTGSPRLFAARIAMIVVAGLLVLFLLFVFVDWCLGWRIIRCEKKKPYSKVQTDPPNNANNRQANGNVRLSTMLPEPDITYTEVDESGIERDLSDYRLNNPQS